MQYAAYLSCASRIAAEVYKLLPDRTRKHSLYRIMVGEMMQLLKHGKLPEKAGQVLLVEYVLPKKKDNTYKATDINQGERAKPLFGGFCFEGEYYNMPDFTNLLTRLKRTKRKIKKIGTGRSVLELLGRRKSEELEIGDLS